MKYLKAFLFFLQSMVNQRYLIQQLVKRDFQNKYLASYIGLPWAFMQPAVIILVMWFAFTYGLKIRVMESGLPFVPWLICAMVPWLFISETLITSSSSLIQYSYLIKKTSFKVGIIPLIKIFTAFIIHLFFACRDRLACFGTYGLCEGYWQPYHSGYLGAILGNPNYLALWHVAGEL